MSDFHASMHKWLCVDLPPVDYDEAHCLQQGLVAARHEGTLGRDVALVLEHPPVFTLGRRGGMDNLMASRESLREKGIRVIQVERGGDITYHGPGQLIVYPIVHLEPAGLGVTEFVTRLEEVMIRAAADWSVAAERSPLNRGVWVGPKKLGSIGITIRKGVSFHGLAMNVTTDLGPFDWIHPCGLHGVRMTSLMQEARGPVNGDEVRSSVKHHLEQVFGIELVATPRPEIERLLKSAR
jgi:lipoate-protein ligase B